MLASQVAFDLSKLPAGWQPIPERIQSSLTDSELSTQQTVAKMCELIREGAADPSIQSIAQTLGADGSVRSICWDAFWFCKHKIRFALDESAVLAMFGERNQVDFMMSPPVLLAMKRPAGDCDDFTMLCCALLECRGIPWEIVTLACDRDDPRRWSHVYCRAILPDGRRLALDPTNGKYLGWQVPRRDVYRWQYWNRDGQPVDGPASIRDLRMHAYARRRGVGDILDSSGQTPADWGFDIGGSLGSGIDRSTYDPSGGVWSAAQAGGSTGGFNWQSLLPSLTKIGGQIGTLAVMPRGSYITTDARGNTVVSNTGLPVASSGSGNLIFYGALALAAVLIFKAVSK